ncbi:XrtA-associated tyrosine autokinase [Bowmanella dokdonensis]|uniref:non-specific protein-tyrosine kinase n=1 Tax=Bowmanella dokdonensis TaxID=751969 RepID=A0A939DQ32_9ALTE|nr:XrtA-associated tyrosine autokinase [Bowmanella dokdonensis]MBN7826674.1 AAA family ATPase [Bowmanella dokdonensis]
MSTIEKALQRKKAAEAERKRQLEAKQQADSSAASETQSKDKETVISRAAMARSKASQQENMPLAELAETEVRPVPVTVDEKPVLEIALDREGFVSLTSSRSRTNEEFRAIKRKVLNNAFGPLAKTLNNPNIVMVTSCNPGEGKTYNAVNLALSIALEQDKTVLLVDADVLRPNVMNTLQVSAGDGLMEHLLGEVSDVSEVMYNTTLDTLRIIPAGKTHHLSTELLASEKMYETVQEFATRYPDRIVIFDTPPLLGINETAVLANLAGQAIVVVEEGRTKLADISTAIESLNPDMAKGFILNKSQRLKVGGDYGYGYYYSGSKE